MSAGEKQLAVLEELGCLNTSLCLNFIVKPSAKVFTASFQDLQNGELCVFRAPFLPFSRERGRHLIFWRFLPIVPSDLEVAFS